MYYNFWGHFLGKIWTFSEKLVVVSMVLLVVSDFFVSRSFSVRLYVGLCFWIFDAGFNFIEVSLNFRSVFVFYDLIIFCCINYIFVIFIYFVVLIIMIVNVCICEIFYCGMGTVGCRIYFICVFGRYYLMIFCLVYLSFLLLEFIC